MQNMAALWRAVFILTLNAFMMFLLRGSDNGLDMDVISGNFMTCVFNTVKKNKERVIKELSASYVNDKKKEEKV